MIGCQKWHAPCRINETSKETMMKLFDVIHDEEMGRVYINCKTGEVFTP